MKTPGRITQGVLAVAMLFAVSCTDTAERDKIIADSNNRIEITKDSLEQILSGTLDEIDHNLQLISEKQEVIAIGPNTASESGISVKERILRNIQMMNTMMDENKQKIADLNSTIKRYKLDNSKLGKKAKATKAQLEDYEKQLAVLKEELSAKDYQIAELNKRITNVETKNTALEERAVTLEKKSGDYEKQVYTAYYTVGKYKELQQHGVLEKKGGILGVGRTKELNEQAGNEYFTQIDIRQTTSIPVMAKKARLITNHPEGSYQFTEGKDQIASLEIKDPEKFWKTSRYMVMELK
jgi:septal ring factor EnvC (AmiA/AmiB activator)